MGTESIRELGKSISQNLLDYNRKGSFLFI
jgi:hypothetical protein